MPLLFNGQILDTENFKDFVSARLPKTKNKFVTFAIENARPSEWINERGIRVQKMTAEYSILTFDTVTINIKGKGDVTGVLQYYETNQRVARGGTIIDNYEPNYVHFPKCVLKFDASKNEALYFYLLVHSKNKDNNEKYGNVPEFHQVKPTEIAKKTVADIDSEIDALNRLKELKANQKQLRAFYETLGHTDWEEHVGGANKDWDTVMAPMYEYCRLKPKDALEKMNSAGLELGSKVVRAFNAGLLKQDGTAIFWGDGFREDLKPNKRKITNIPKGRTHDYMEWFINNFLRSEVDVMQEINTELALHEVSA